jgi:DsbC/DsbD-like thiol-disulfide interchange protein
MVGGMKNITQAFVCTAVGVLLILGLAGCGAQQPDDDNPVQVTVSTDYDDAVPGHSITLVWRFKMAPNWHLYWIGRNDSGFAPTIDLELPPGWIAGGLHWPAPVRYLSEGDILDHVYHGELVLLQKVGVPEGASATGTAVVTANIEWLACKTSCVPGKATVSLEIPLSVHHAGPPSELSAQVLEKLPLPLPDGMFDPHWTGQKFHLTGTGGTQLSFMPTVDCGKLVNLIRDGQGPELALRFEAEGKTVGPVRGLVTSKEKDGSIRAYIVDFPAKLLSDKSSGG